MPRFGRTYPMPLWKPPKLFPAFDAAAAGATSSSSPASLGTALTVGGNLIVLATETYAGQPATAAVGGKTMTNLGTVYNNNGSSNGGTQLFYLLNSGLAGSQTPTASWATVPTYALVMALSFKNVRSVSALTYQYSYTGAAAQSIGVPSVPNGIVVSALGGFSLGNPPLASFLGTQKYNNQLGTYIQLMMGYTVATSTSTNIGATSSSSGTNWSFLGIALS